MQIIAFLLLISILIFAHEFGHFIFAKIFGVKVIKFSIGMGPEIIKYQGKETKYTISLLPIGGYVSLLGHDPTIEVTEADRNRSLPSKANWQRFIIMFAGPAFNLLLPFLLYFIYAIFDTQHVAPVVGQVNMNGPAGSIGLKSGYVITEVNGERVKYWEDFSRKISKFPGTPVSMKFFDGEKEHSVMITPTKEETREKISINKYEGKIGVTPYNDSFTLFFSSDKDFVVKSFDTITHINGKKVESRDQILSLKDKNSVEKLTILRPERVNVPLLDFFTLKKIELENVSTEFLSSLLSPEMAVWWVHPSSVAQKAGFKIGDYILSINDQIFSHWVFLQNYLDKQKDDNELTFKVKRGEQILEIKTAQRLIKGDEVTGNPYYELGIVPYFIPESTPMLKIVTSNTVISDSISEMWYQTKTMTQLVFTAIVKLVTGNLSFKHLGGPIMMYEASGLALEYGWLSLLKLMAILSINLGLLNLLPIPMLDGGHILFILAESIRRKPVNQRFKEITSFIGLVCLILLMILVFKNDIENFIFK
ncbi:RIP metalloprotease RseP [bacterium]|nr:RIP metalloprotease RseP [bacterium]